jgi:predicted kinase
MAKEKIVRINVGIPGSGKSTETQNFIEENPGWVKVSRDDFRFMLKNQPMMDGKGENLVTDLFFETARKAILSGYNVILDNTFCKRTYINDAINRLNDLASIEFKLFNTPLEECIKRDRLRKRKVGETIIKKMHKDYETLIETYSFPEIPKAVRLKKDHSADWNPLLPDVIISDIDGTVAHMNGKRGPFEWHRVGVDDADWSVIRMLKTWTDRGEKLIMLSGRDESCRKETEEWLKEKGIHFHKLLMRPTGDFRKDSIIKAEIYEKELKGKYNIIMIYDDRDQVVETWRSLGLKCAQVEPGEF